MKTLQLIIVILLAIPLVAEQNARGGRSGIVVYTIPVASGATSVSDDFNRADSDSLGANWTEITGDIDIASNEALSPALFDATEKAAVYTGSALTGPEQYIKVTLTANSGLNSSPGIVFRNSNAGGAYYELTFDSANNQAVWWYVPSPGGTRVQIDLTTAFGTPIAYPMTFGVVCTGTGNSTEIRVWQSPTANAPDSGGATWDSAGATKTITGDPATAVDTGNYVGIGGTASLGWAVDNWFGGVIP